MSHRRTVNHAEQIGNLQPISLPAGPSSEELRAALAAHEANALAPPVHHQKDWDGKTLDTAAQRRERKAWLDHKGHLEIQLHMAESREANVWRDANGQPVQPEAWPGGLQDLGKMSSKKAEEMRAYRARKAAGETMAPGRPRAEEPTPAAIQKRRERERVPTCSHRNHKGELCAMHPVPGSEFCVRHQAA